MALALDWPGHRGTNAGGSRRARGTGYLCGRRAKRVFIRSGCRPHRVVRPVAGFSLQIARTDRCRGDAADAGASRTADGFVFRAGA